jgi:hypothetical protein
MITTDRRHIYFWCIVIRIALAGAVLGAAVNPIIGSASSLSDDSVLLSSTGRDGDVPVVAWVGLDPDSEDRRLVNTRIAISRIDLPETSSLADTEVALALAKLGEPIRLIAFGRPGRGTEPTAYLAKAIEISIRESARVVVVPFHLIERSTENQGDLESAILNAWHNGVLVLSAPVERSAPLPPGILSLVPFVVPDSQECNRSKLTAEDSIVFCFHSLESTPQVSRLTTSDAITLISAVAAAQVPGNGPHASLEKANRVMALAALPDNSWGFNARGEQAPDALRFAGQKFRWDERLSQANAPIDLRAQVGASRDPELQVLLGVNEWAKIRDLVALELLAKISPVYVFPWKDSIGVFRFHPGMPTADRALAIQILRSLRGTESEDIFFSVAPDSILRP